MKKQNLSHYFEWVSAAISPFPWQCSDLYVMENQQRGKFTEKQNKANKTNSASSKTAKTVLLWWIHSKWKHPRTKDIVNTFQKKMDKEKTAKSQGKYYAWFQVQLKRTRIKNHMAKGGIWPQQVESFAIQTFFFKFTETNFALECDYTRLLPISENEIVWKSHMPSNQIASWMHKWNVYVHSTPPYQPFEYSHKDAKLSKGLPSSNKNIHQMLLVHDSKRCNCNSFVWQSKSDYFLPLQRIQNTFKIELCARWCLFF